MAQSHSIGRIIWPGHRDYLVQGYAINERRLAQKQQEVQTLKDGIRIPSRAISDKAGDEGLEWLNYFAKGLELLDDYDHEQLDSKGLSKQPAVYPEDYQTVIASMREEFGSGIFGKEKDGGFYRGCGLAERLKYH